jgi:predicted peroxiredoxin
MNGWTPMMFGDVCITLIGAIVRPAIGLPESRRPEYSISISLSSADVDLVRTRTIYLTHMKPLDALADLVKDFLPAGGTTWAGTPCVKTRGYVEDDLLDGVIVSGASTMHELIQVGVATLSF